MMTKDEFKAKQRVWGKAIENVLVDMSMFTNHKHVKAMFDTTPIIKGYLDCIEVMSNSFETDDLIMITPEGAKDNDD